MTITALMESRLWLTTGRTMLHFLWVGGALGLVAAVGRRALRAAPPEVRYGFALSCLAAVTLAPVVVAVFLTVTKAPEPSRHVPRPFTVSALIPWPAEASAPALTTVRSWPRRTTEPFNPVVPGDGLRWGRLPDTAAAVLPWLWLVGAPATFALLATGLVGAERLRRQGRPLIEGELPARARRLADLLGIVRPVALAVCDRLVSPVLIGVVRPLILLPPAALTGWSAEQVEMALLHELAHVRRLDNLVNLGQRLVESALFFHPVVWWVSGWVRLEREHCCDRLVVTRTGRARPYAELLASLATNGGRPGRAVVAMAESPVVVRIRCILNLEDPSMRLSRPVVAFAAALLLTPALLIALQAAAPAQDEDPKPEPAAQHSPEKLDTAKIDDLFRRAQHGATMFEDVQGRAHALSRLAAARSRLGDRDAARPLFEEAVRLGETVRFDDSYYSPHILLWIARAQAGAGFRDEALRTLRRLLQVAEAPVERDSRKIDLYANMLKIQVDLEDRDGIQETLRRARQFYTTSKDPAISTFAPQSLVRLQAFSGDLLGALRMIDDPALFQNPNAENVRNLRHGALFAIVQAIGPNNREGADAVLEAARQAVDANRDERPWRGQMTRNQDLHAIADAQARLGQFNDARKTANAIDAETLPGHLAESARVEFLDEQRFQKAQAFATIAEGQVEAGDREGARQSARAVIQIVAATRAVKYQGFPLQRAIQVLARAGKAEEALRLAHTMSPSPAQRLKNYESVARARREAGDEAGARETLQETLELIRKQIDTTELVAPIDPPSSSHELNQLLAEAAHLQALLGDVPGAIETAQDQRRGPGDRGPETAGRGSGGGRRPERGAGGGRSDQRPESRGGGG